MHRPRVVAWAARLELLPTQYALAPQQKMASACAPTVLDRAEMLMAVGVQTLENGRAVVLVHAGLLQGDLLQHGAVLGALGSTWVARVLRRACSRLRSPLAGLTVHKLLSSANDLLEYA